MELQGKVAVVTGGSRGIGKAISLELARRGVNIAFSYLRNHQAARQTEREIQALGVQSLSVRTHLGDADGIRQLFSKVDEQFDRLDILINNAASGVQRSAMDLGERHWDWTFDVNAKGPWMCAKEAVPLMKHGGTIINISSLGSTRVLPYYLAIGASKAALETITRYLAVELASHGISVNAVAGGVVETEALDHFPNREEMLTETIRRTPAERMVTPQDMANVVTFLCTADAAMIRGQTLVIDGGYSLVGF